MKNLRTLIIKLLGGYDEPPPQVDETFQNKNDKYIERTTKDIEQLTSRHTLSGQEFDKQVVALAGGGLALTITLSKDIVASEQASWLGFLFACWGGFLVALIVNLISYRVSSANYNLMIERLTYYRDCAEGEKEENSGYEKGINEQINKKTKIVGRLNLWAMIACLSGIAFFIIFTLVNKYNTYGRAELTPTTATADNRIGAHQGATVHDSTTQSRTATEAATGSRTDTPNTDSGRN